MIRPRTGGRITGIIGITGWSLTWIPTSPTTIERKTNPNLPLSPFLIPLLAHLFLLNRHLVPANRARAMNPQPLLKIKIKKRNQRHNSKVLKDYDCKDLKMRKFLVLNWL